jgi:hypothetical protein
VPARAARKPEDAYSDSKKSRKLHSNLKYTFLKTVRRDFPRQNKTDVHSLLLKMLQPHNAMNVIHHNIKYTISLM